MICFSYLDCSCFISIFKIHMNLSIYATSNDTFNILTPLLSRFIKLNLPEYDLETIQAIVRHVWEHTRDVREAIAIAKIVDTSDEVNSIASTLRRYSDEMWAINKRRP